MTRDIPNDAKISDLIARLEKLKVEHGDINVVTSTPDNHWGSIYNYITEDSIEIHMQAQPQGPKSGKSEKAVVISRY